MKVILCGYHWSGCEALRQLLSAGHEVFVYTHEGPYFVPSLIDYCEKTRTAYSLENVSRAKLPFAPDVIASIYYRNIIKQNVIDASRGRIFNLHPSLLPLYRGCSSLTWAIIDQQPYAGYTYHYIDAGCDTGDIILQERVLIREFDTQGTLYQRVATDALLRFGDALAHAASGAPGKPQTGMPTYFGRGCPHEGSIDPSWSRERIESFIRAMIHPPYPPATFLGQEVRSLQEFDALVATSCVAR